MTRGGAERRSSPNVEQAMQQPKRPLRILVVENDGDTRTFFKLFLQQLGHYADAAEGVSEALSTLRQARYDVLFADIGLADGSGWDLMNIVRESAIPCPAYSVAMTGYGLPEDRARSEAAGFRHHLLKPVEPARLRTLLDEAAREVAGPH